MRVYEYAKSLNMSSKEIITILKRLEIPVSNHMSVMDRDVINKVEQFFKDVKQDAASKVDGDNSKPKPNHTSNENIPAARPKTETEAGKASISTKPANKPRSGQQARTDNANHQSRRR